MDKENLPRLKTDVFTTVTKSRRTPVQKTAWQNKRFAGAAGKRAAAIVQSIGRPIKRTGASKERNEEVDIGYKRLMIKTGICAAIAIVILTLSSIDTPVTNNITDMVGEAVNHEFDIEEDIGRLKFVQSLTGDTQDVFSPLSAEAVVYPAEGEVITQFGESGSQGVRIAPVGTEIVNIAKGTVTEVGDIDGSGYVKVVLDTGETTVYYNVKALVQYDDIVMPGQPIGHTQSDYLYLEMTLNGEYIDPMVYIMQKTAFVVH